MASQANMPVCRSPLFYWDFAVIQVEDQLYKVPRHILESSSEIFKSMFALPQPDISTIEGTSDDHPIRLEGVKREHFDALLTALLIDTRHTSYPEAGLEQQQWVWVLDLANMWQMPRMRSLAIKELSQSKISDVDRIIYGQKYAVVDWVISGYRDVTSRTIVISTKDAERLGVELLLSIWQIQLRTAGNMKYSSTYLGLVKVQLSETFGSILEDVYQRSLNLGDPEREQRPVF